MREVPKQSKLSIELNGVIISNDSYTRHLSKLCCGTIFMHRGSPCMKIRNPEHGRNSKRGSYVVDLLTYNSFYLPYNTEVLPKDGVLLINEIDEVIQIEEKNDRDYE